MTKTTKVTVFDVIESAHSFRKVRGSVENTETNAGYKAVAFRVPYADKVLVQHEDGTLVRVIVDRTYPGVIGYVHFDSNNRAVYHITLDQAIGPEQSRDWVARREELEEVEA